ncbi:type II secretion system F family protein [Homoserinimonas sp. OAct 916]|uniref:type II secretion system F family protein n=1 Tax=Homoserinimonas sp. OAct 916 TaxID=2211450 RepID=UPI000DBE8F30|nr:type II secretion system F family protein [Homoserinimonas sp. OAct 916]
MRQLPGRGRTGPPAIEQVARLTRRLAVLLAAGVTPGSAWGYLADTGRSATAGSTATGRRDSRAEPVSDTLLGPGLATVVDAVVDAQTDGGSVPDAVIAAVGGTSSSAHTSTAPSSTRARSGAAEQSAWRSLAAAWSVAADTGAPLADCLHRMADSFDEHGSRQRELEVALAGPAATARMVMWLPVVGVLFGAVLGFDTLGVLFGSVPGLLCLAFGGGLMLAGGRWSRAMIRAAQPQQTTPGLIVDLTAIAMAGGGSVDAARMLAADAARRFLGSPDATVKAAHAPPAPRRTARATTGEQPHPRSSSQQAERPEHRRGDRNHDGREANINGPNSNRPNSREFSSCEPNSCEHAIVDHVLALATRAGIPAAQLLRAEAAQLRRQARYDGQKAVAAVAVKLMIPLGLCVLPAFMLLGVAPLLMAVLSSTIAEF